MSAKVSEAVKHLQSGIGVNADGIFGPNTLKAAARFYNMSPSQAAHFFGQLNVESAGFTVFEENLNYSAQGLLSVFPKYFTADTANTYARKPIEIANKVYANRMGNGSEKSFDGWKYRGRGAIQLTGRSNYEAFANFLGTQEPVQNPDCISVEFAFMSALWFFSRNNLWEIADKGVSDDTILAITKKINGGTNGLEQRKEKTKKYYEYFNR